MNEKEDEWIEERKKEADDLLRLFELESICPVTDPVWQNWRQYITNGCVLHVAAEKSPKLLARLLATDCGKTMLDFRHTGRLTPLYCAVAAENMESIKLLIRAGAHSKCKYILTEDCPVVKAYRIYEGHTAKYNLGGVMLGAHLTEEKRIAFWETHMIPATNNQYREYMTKCDKWGVKWVQRSNASNTITAVLLCLKKKVIQKKVQKDVVSYVLKPLLRGILEHEAWPKVLNK